MLDGYGFHVLYAARACLDMAVQTAAAQGSGVESKIRFLVVGVTGRLPPFGSTSAISAPRLQAGGRKAFYGQLLAFGSYALQPCNSLRHARPGASQASAASSLVTSIELLDFHASLYGP